MERTVHHQSESWFRGLIPTASTPQGWMLEQPIVLIKQFNATEQQFQSFEPRGLLSSIPTPQGWMQQQPNNEIFIPQFNVSQQQFSILNPVFPDVQSTLFVVDANDNISSSTTIIKGNFGPLAFIDVKGTDCSDMQILGYSSTETLFYDESNTQCFYLKQPSTVLKVSPAYAKNWLVDSGKVSIVVYDPFGTSPFSIFSNVP